MISKPSFLEKTKNVTAVITKLPIIISNVFSKSAVNKDTSIIGRARLSFTDRNRENTKTESYIQVLGTKALRKNTAIDG